MLNALGHFHPALVHFPVALLLAAAALEAWAALRRAPASPVALVLNRLGALGAVLAVASGLLLFHAGDFQGRALGAARVHRLLGLLGLALALGAAWAGFDPGARKLTGRRLFLYRTLLGLSGAVVGLAGHYGGWIVFGWGRIWLP